MSTLLTRWSNILTTKSSKGMQAKQKAKSIKHLRHNSGEVKLEDERSGFQKV